MGKKSEDQEPLSNFQNTAVTGRNDNVEVTLNGKHVSKKLKAFLTGDADSKAVKPIVIKAAGLKDSFCNYTYELEVAENTTDTISRKSGVLIHDDLRSAFSKLNAHLAFICEEIPVEAIDDIETIERYNPDVHKEGSVEDRVSRFYVSDFRLNGTGENESITLVGTKRLSTGEYVGLTTPKIKRDDRYRFINELLIAVDDAIVEVEEYMNGKCAPKLVQSEMEFEEANSSEEEL